jgi:hypothetical protein
MKKIIIACVIGLIMTTPFVAASPTVMNAVKDEIKQSCSSNENFTHTVMIEYGTTTTCPYCVIASGQLYSIYNSGDLDFYYVSLVYDEGNANVRSRFTELGITSIPDVYFDGGYKRLLGAQDDEQPYRNAISQCGNREVPDIDITVNAEWKGGGTIKITGTVTNNEAEEYKGHLRVYVVEKESRWDDNGGNPYHFAALDIPIDKSLSVSQSQQPGNPRPLGETYTFQKTWFGAIYGFSDITQENTMVIAAVFDPDTEDAVQAAAAEPTSSSEPNGTALSFIYHFIATLKIMYDKVLMKIQSAN